MCCLNLKIIRLLKSICVSFSLSQTLVEDSLIYNALSFIQSLHSTTFPVYRLLSHTGTGLETWLHIGGKEIHIL